MWLVSCLILLYNASCYCCNDPWPICYHLEWSLGSKPHWLWNTPWLPSVTWVWDLLHADNCSWDVSKVMHVFSTNEVDGILSIHVWTSGLSDHLFWHFNSTGVFSIKLVYGVACDFVGWPLHGNISTMDSGHYMVIWDCCSFVD